MDMKVCCSRIGSRTRPERSGQGHTAPDPNYNDIPVRERDTVSDSTTSYVVYRSGPPRTRRFTRAFSPIVTRNCGLYRNWVPYGISPAPMRAISLLPFEPLASPPGLPEPRRVSDLLSELLSGGFGRSPSSPESSVLTRPPRRYQMYHHKTRSHHRNGPTPPPLNRTGLTRTPSFKAKQLVFKKYSPNNKEESGPSEL